ncbi:hypothetical protein H0H81_003629 [Sphagnurus paluster]|uniref:Zinc finger PHD-type domain-containing protein n=1 Tax=Sphagnurus paluster TaxID=117069 RepID=A0A9P7KK67_9AGAR|nr:hypothetical protein H0H81_003629 [Sphagnurus paluster]
MSGSRRNRMNLNVPVDPSRLPGHHVPQQSDSTAPQYQYQLATASAPGSIPHPLAYMTHYRHYPTQAHPTPAPKIPQTNIESEQAPPQQRATLPGPYATTPLQTTHAPGEFLVEKLIGTLTPILTAHQHSTTYKIDTFLETLSGHVKGVKEEAKNQVIQLAEAMQKAFVLQQTGNKTLSARMEKLEKVIGASYDRDDNKSLLSRLDALTFTLEELLERAKDPEALAAKASIILKPLPHLVESTTSPIRELYTDVSVDPHTPDVISSESQFTALHAIATQTEQTYLTIGTNARTPEPRRLPPQFVSTGVATSPTPQLPRLKIANSNCYSDRTKAVGDVDSSDEKSPQLELPRRRKPIIVAHSDSEPDHESLVSVVNESSGVRMSSHFNNSPVPSRNLSAADWSDDGGHHEVGSDDGSYDVPLLPAFRPTTSPSVAKQYSVLVDDKNPFEGTVASLRHHTLGDAHAGPKPSPPPPTVPFHPRPSVSPLPSPASSASPPPHRSKSVKKAHAIFNTTLTSPTSSLPVIVSSPGYETVISSPKWTRKAVPSPPLKAPAPIANEDPNSMPAQTPDIIPDSEDESELSVTHMITNTSANVEDLHSEAEAEAQLTEEPLFLPTSSPPEVSSHLPTTRRPPSKSYRQPIVHSSPISISTDDSSPTDIPVSPTKTEITRSIKKPTMPRLKVPEKHLPRPRPLPINVVAPPEPKSQSPIYISSRSPSPLSELSESESSESESDSDTAARIIPVKKRPKAETVMSTSASTPADDDEPAKAPRIDLKTKLLKKTEQSAAVTRVKKRKASGVDPEPPLKRARQKADLGGSGGVKPVKKVLGAVGNGKEKAKERRAKSTESGASTSTRSGNLRKRMTGCKWPKKITSGDKKFNTRFIACDDCLLWFHYGCVGITDANEPMKKDSFTCPACLADGYPVNECTWEEEDAMFDPHNFIQHFNNTARNEGNDPEIDTDSTILLREASEGGWTDPNGSD